MLEAIAPLFDAYRGFFTQTPDLDVSRRFLTERIERGESVVFAAFDGEERHRVSAALSALLVVVRAAAMVSERSLRCRRTSSDAASASAWSPPAPSLPSDGGSRAILVELPFSEPHLATFYGQLGFGKDAVFELYRLVLGEARG